MSCELGHQEGTRTGLCGGAEAQVLRGGVQRGIREALPPALRSISGAAGSSGPQAQGGLVPAERGWPSLRGQAPPPPPPLHQGHTGSGSTGSEAGHLEVKPGTESTSPLLDALCGHSLHRPSPAPPPLCSSVPCPSSWPQDGRRACGPVLRACGGPRDPENSGQRSWSCLARLPAGAPVVHE